MLHFLIGPVLGAIALHLYNEHKKRGIAQCSECEHFEQVGTNLKFISYCSEGENPGTEIAFCKKCKPEIFK